MSVVSNFHSVQIIVNLRLPCMCGVDVACRPTCIGVCLSAEWHVSAVYRLNCYSIPRVRGTTHSLIVVWIMYRVCRQLACHFIFYVAAKATYIRLLHGKIGILEGVFGPSSVHRGRTHIVLG